MSQIQNVEASKRPRLLWRNIYNLTVHTYCSTYLSVRGDLIKIENHSHCCLFPSLIHGLPMLAGEEKKMMIELFFLMKTINLFLLHDFRLLLINPLFLSLTFGTILQTSVNCLLAKIILKRNWKNIFSINWTRIINVITYCVYIVIYHLCNNHSNCSECAIGSPAVMRSCQRDVPPILLLSSLHSHGPHPLGRPKRLQSKPINLCISLVCATFLLIMSYTQMELLKSGSCTELSLNWAEKSIAIFSILPATAYINLVNVFDVISHCA